MEGATNAQGKGALGTGLGELGTGELDALEATRDDNLAGTVVVGCNDGVAAGGNLLAYVLDGLVGEADDGGHRGGLHLAGFLHGHGTGIDELEAILEGEGAAGYHGRELAERVAGNHVGAEVVAHAEGGDD